MPSGAGPVSVARQLPEATGQRTDQVLMPAVAGQWQPSLQGLRSKACDEVVLDLTEEDEGPATDAGGPPPEASTKAEEGEGTNGTEVEGKSQPLKEDDDTEPQEGDAEEEACPDGNEDEKAEDEGDDEDAEAAQDEQTAKEEACEELTVIEEAEEASEPEANSNDKLEDGGVAKDAGPDTAGSSETQVPDGEEDEVEAGEIDAEHMEEDEEEAEEDWCEGEEEEEENADEEWEEEEDPEAVEEEEAGAEYDADGEADDVEEMEPAEIEQKREDKEQQSAVMQEPNMSKKKQTPPPSSSKEEEVEESWPLPGEAAKGSGKASRRKQVQEHDAVASSSKVELQQQVRKLMEENRILKVELGQARFQVKTLSDLRSKAELAQREAAQAKAMEAKALKEVEHAKEYATRRIEFVRHEKAEMIQTVQMLERDLTKVKEREQQMRSELKDAWWDRDNALSKLDDLQRGADHWKKECNEQTARCKQLQARIRQLEDKARAKPESTIDGDAANGSTVGSAAGSTEAAGAGMLPQIPDSTSTRRRATSSSRQGGSGASSSASTSQAAPWRHDADTLLLNAARVSSIRRCCWWVGVALSTFASVLSPKAPEHKAGASAKSTNKRRAQSVHVDQDAEGEASARQQMILASLVVFIAGMMVVKICS